MAPLAATARKSWIPSAKEMWDWSWMSGKSGFTSFYSWTVSSSVPPKKPLITHLTLLVCGSQARLRRDFNNGEFLNIKLLDHPYIRSTQNKNIADNTSSPNLSCSTCDIKESEKKSAFPVSQTIACFCFFHWKLMKLHTSIYLVFILVEPSVWILMTVKRSLHLNQALIVTASCSNTTKFSQP